MMDVFKSTVFTFLLVNLQLHLVPSEDTEDKCEEDVVVILTVKTSTSVSCRSLCRLYGVCKGARYDGSGDCTLLAGHNTQDWDKAMMKQGHPCGPGICATPGEVCTPVEGAKDYTCLKYAGQLKPQQEHGHKTVDFDSNNKKDDELEGVVGWVHLSTRRN